MGCKASGNQLARLCQGLWDSVRARLFEVLEERCGVLADLVRG